MRGGRVRQASAAGRSGADQGARGPDRAQRAGAGRGARLHSGRSRWHRVDDVPHGARARGRADRERSRACRMDQSAGARRTGRAHAARRARREAAAVLLAAPAYVVYKVDDVNAPMALAVKELKIGTIATRVIRYANTGVPDCVTVFYFQNTKDKSDWAISVSTKALIDPAVV